MNESEQMLVNELRRIERAVDKRKKLLEDLSSKKRRNLNRRYVLDIPIDLIKVPDFDESFIASTQPITRSFVVDRDCTYFCCRELVYTPSIVGLFRFPSPESGTVQGKFSIPNTAYFGFNWEVRDTYSDRAWQNFPLPDLAMGSGKTSGLPVGRSAILPAGTEVLFTLYPLSWAIEDTYGEGGLSPTSLSVQVSFVGFEVLG